MARIARPWFWAERQGWYVNRDGKRVPLGAHPAGSPPPKKARGRWNPPEPILQAFHALMAAKPEAALPRPAGTPAMKISLFSLTDKYLAWCEAHRERRTFEGYLWHLKRFDDHLRAMGTDSASFPAASLRPFHVTEYLDANPDWGPTYRRNVIASVKRLYKWGEEEGYVESDPLRKLKKPMAARREDFTTPEEYVAIRDSYRPDDPFRLFLEFAWGTGARPQEIRAIEPRHVHLDKAAILMPPKEEKTRKKWRIIRLEGRALDIVVALMQNPARERLFLNEDGKPWTSSAINCRFGRLKEKLGKRHAIYSVRHGFCQKLLVQGVDHLSVAALLGHADGQMVQRVYSHMDQADDHLREILREKAD